jgi:hypothetical protein
MSLWVIMLLFNVLVVVCLLVVQKRVMAYTCDIEGVPIASAEQTNELTNYCARLANHYVRLFPLKQALSRGSATVRNQAQDNSYPAAETPTHSPEQSLLPFSISSPSALQRYPTCG